MSSKNLKVYKMHFTTEVRRLLFNVKFPCKVKMTWKRSNQSTETEAVPLKDGVVEFNETLKLKVNMYLNISTNKFVEKKCMYSFVIVTQKGEKSAGTVVVDLAEFFNKRIYEMDKDFALEKCPVPGTKINMKLSYSEGQETGYDSMSCISAANPHDSSLASMDPLQLSSSQIESAGGSALSEKSVGSQLTNEKSEATRQEKSEGGPKQETYQKLQASDVIEYPLEKGGKQDNNKIGQNIRSINNLTSKINDFVSSRSKNIKFEMEGYKMKIGQLEEEVRAERMAKEQAQEQVDVGSKKRVELETEFANYKAESESRLQEERRQNSELASKNEQNQAMMTQLESKMSESGESQNEYIAQLKSSHAAAEEKMKAELAQLREELLAERKTNNNSNARISELEGTLKEVRQQHAESQQHNETIRADIMRKEQQLEETRINLEQAYEKMVAQLNAL